MTRKTATSFTFGAFVLAFAPGIVASGFGQSASYVYVETNTKPVNAIRAFKRGPNGQLRDIPGSPFTTGGAGTGYSGTAIGPEDSDQEIITNADHTLLFAINAGSDSIAVMRIGDSGELKPVPGSPFASGGSDPVSLDIANDILFVANKAGDPARPTTALPNYTTLRIQSDATLVPTGYATNDSSHELDSTISVALGSSPEQIHRIPGTSFAYGDDFLGNLLQRFYFAPDGELHQFAPVALPTSLFSDTTTPRIPQGLWNHPKLPLLYVGVPLVNKLAIYRYNRIGGLTFLRAVPNEGQTICWLRTNSSGTRLYSTDTSTNSVGVYDLSDPENPVQLQEFYLAGAGSAFQLQLSPDDRNLYVLSPRTGDVVALGQGNLLHTLSIDSDGTLSETRPPIAFLSLENARPRGIAVVSK